MRRVLLIWLCLSLLGAVDPPRIEPTFQRIELSPTDSADVTVTISSASDTIVTHVLFDCACLRVVTTLPQTSDASGKLTLRMRATGLHPGIEVLRVATSAGMVEAEL